MIHNESALTTNVYPGYKTYDLLSSKSATHLEEKEQTSGTLEPSGSLEPSRTIWNARTKPSCD
jgi:hypothetical protein